jgi:hypothetical protein
VPNQRLPANRRFLAARTKFSHRHRPNRKGQTIVSGRSDGYTAPGQQINFSGVLSKLNGIVKPASA